MGQNLYDMWIWTSVGISDMVLAVGGTPMKKTTREQCEEIIAIRVETLVTRWQEDKTQEERMAVMSCDGFLSVYVSIHQEKQD